MSFQQGLSGLSASAKYLDVIGNNIANSGTVGFKSSSTQFADVFAVSLAGAGGLQAGIGTKVAAIRQQFTQGNISTTNNPLDLAINGDGFFRMSQNGVITYSRNGQFQLDKSGYIVNATGQRLTGYAANALGAIVGATPEDLQISLSDLSPNASTTATISFNLDSTTTVPAVPPAFDATDPDTYDWSTSMTAYDSLGNAHAVTYYFVKTGANTWDMYGQLDGEWPIALADLGGGPGVAVPLTFNSDGSLDTVATTTPITVDLDTTANGSDAISMSLNIGSATQFGSSFGINSIVQDGYTSGRIAGLSIDKDGMVLGNYTNGQTRVMGQIALAAFLNPNGLQPLGNNQWAETSESGQPTVGKPGTGTLGYVQSGAVEESNVDLTQELVNLIIAQRTYQANAQTIQAQDQILQTLVNLR